MPQEFCIYKCYSCNIFQVHIFKKSSKKWVCKMCGEKQSIIKVLGQGSAKECREHVQKLNLMKGSELQLTENETIEINSKNEEDESQTNKRKSCDDSGILDEDDKRNVTALQSGSLNRLPPVKVSKWACFLDSDSDIE